MADIRRRLDHELATAVARLRTPRDGVALLEPPAAIPDTGAFADELDSSQVSESREIGFATRELLAARVQQLASALERLDAGAYGTCVECARAIPAARLRATPEVQACIRCQDGLERRRRAASR